MQNRPEHVFAPRPPSLTKRCGRCQQELSKNEFAANGSARDGLHPHCRPCASAQSRQAAQGRWAAAKAAGTTRAAPRKGALHVAHSPDLPVVPEAPRATLVPMLIDALRLIARGEAMRDGRVVVHQLGPDGMRLVAERALTRAAELGAPSAKR